ncbi:malonyl-CoA synthase [Aestuariicella sp. G3-2]|uniref:malonate--CoA ligase n=1 Tax=Pseudomaricurvus albidus TaxID=2842452 RepID=UPI001C0AD7CB|nr:malonyl-CoA synthase [Aestuariicella albida]MBU3068567.1 malonyl-CoA synthase [Aestuariicella albida]
MDAQNQSNLYAAFRSRFPADLSAPLLTTAEGRVYTYADAEERSAQLANCLMQLGLKPGDRLTVQVEKSVEMLWLYLATVRAGLVFHPLNTAYTNDELEYFLTNAEPSMVVCDEAKRADFEVLCQRANVPNLLTLNADGTGTLIDSAGACAADFATAVTQPEDMACLLYSSGTTGRPKGIMLSHRNLIENARVLVDAWGFTADDCLLHALPVFHVHGLFVAIGCVLMSGASMRWLPKYDVDQVLNHLPHSTVMMGVPTYYTRLLAEPTFGAEQCRHVRLFISGSAPLLADTFVEFEQRTGQSILERYGMTETGMNTSNPLHGERRAGTVGFPLPGVSVRIVGNDGEVLGPGEVGDLQVKGANVFSGYWKMPEKTAEDFSDDGFFITGDKGMIDEDGYVAIVGRAKDMVICGGLNVYPKEIELLIDELPGVVESAVIGLPHDDFGEAVAAVIVAEPGSQLSEADVKQHVKAHAANFKIPKQVFFVDSLPRNTMGKVQKNILRATYGPDKS